MTITVDELKDLLSYCEIRQVEKRTILVKEGEVDNYLNMVVKGLVMKYVRVKKSDMILQLATEGHVIHSEISFLTRTPSLVFVETLEPTIMVSLTYDKMEEALNKFPQGERLGRLILTGMYVKKEESRYYRLLRSCKRKISRLSKCSSAYVATVPQK
jgi:CRP-like cAMP-binding protein